MAKNQRTYEWVNGRLHEVESYRQGMYLADLSKPRPFMKVERWERLGIQAALLVFTASCVTMVFAGGALCAFLVVAYSIIFG